MPAQPTRHLHIEFETDRGVGLTFEWNMLQTVNVYEEYEDGGTALVDCFTFMFIPTEELVVEACTDWYNDWLSDFAP